MDGRVGSFSSAMTALDKQYILCTDVNVEWTDSKETLYLSLVERR